MGSLGVTWADIGCPLGVVGGLRGGLGRLGGAMGGLKLQNTHIQSLRAFHRAGQWGMGKLTGNGGWTRGNCQEQLKQGRGR